MIPKVIHYCWFGRNPLPEPAKRCIEGWKRVCPAYEIREWNEENYDIGSACAFVRDAYRSRKWAFVSDYVRLDVVYRYGGIYLDTDVELLRAPDELLADGRGYFGFENEGTVASGLGFASEKGNEIVREMKELYHHLQFDGNRLTELACPGLNTAVLKKHGLKTDNTYQVIEGMKILPTEYLCPENIYSGRRNYTCQTVSVHHYDASWMNGAERRRLKGIAALKRRLPAGMVGWLRALFRTGRK